MSDDVDLANELVAQRLEDTLAEHARRYAVTSEAQGSRQCRICDEEIPLERRRCVPGVQTCIDCQNELETALYPPNRRN